LLEISILEGYEEVHE